jgi:hypothetical protein
LKITLGQTDLVPDKTLAAAYGQDGPIDRLPDPSVLGLSPLLAPDVFRLLALLLEALSLFMFIIPLTPCATCTALAPIGFLLALFLRLRLGAAIAFRVFRGRRLVLVVPPERGAARTLGAVHSWLGNARHVMCKWTMYEIDVPWLGSSKLNRVDQRVCTGMVAVAHGVE